MKSKPKGNQWCNSTPLIPISKIVSPSKGSKYCGSLCSIHSKQLFEEIEIVTVIESSRSTKRFGSIGQVTMHPPIGLGELSKRTLGCVVYALPCKTVPYPGVSTSKNQSPFGILIEFPYILSPIWKCWTKVWGARNAATWPV